jgi:hypothetical protein
MVRSAPDLAFSLSVTSSSLSQAFVGLALPRYELLASNCHDVLLATSVFTVRSTLLMAAA